MHNNDKPNGNVIDFPPAEDLEGFVDIPPAEDSEPPVIGKVSSTERDPSTSSTFSFWVQNGVLINPFDYVSVENFGGSRTIGVVKEILAPTDAKSHLANYVSSSFGDVEAEGNTRRVTTVIAWADVAANTGVESPHTRRGRRAVWYPALNDSPVRFATNEEVHLALGMDALAPEDGLPAGVILRSSGDPLPLLLDRRYVLGPEAAHVNVSGTSGLAAKTSYLMFLLRLVMEYYGNETAAIIFNVKQQDLLFIDEEPAPGFMDDYDRNLYRILGFGDLDPFTNVRYYFPYHARDISSVYENPSEKHAFYYAYALDDVYDELDLLFSEIDDPQFTLASIASHVAQDYGRMRFRRAVNEGYVSIPAGTEVRTWTHLKFFDDFPQDTIGGGNPRSVLGRFKRHLRRLTTPSVFVDNRTPTALGGDVYYLGDVIRESLAPGDIVVVDIQPFEDRIGTQGFIVGDIVRRLKEAYRENRDRMPRHTVILIDELNRYVPSGTPLTALGREIVDLARVGRAEGVTLFTAQQFRADIHHQVYENCATSLVGITGSTELSRPAYDFLDKQTKAVVGGLEPGEMVLVNRRLKQPVRIVFPKPPYKRQER
ncbi:MAG: ATP-binding protein [Syntrophothermus sp.]|uniref:hypothetical protein n=1 Tax=Syntrophothermus sp. TaxID=2736299 RepID=UPI00257E0DBB|nr:hypothetical protein [Syntrophothermus sp.]NSW84484.1 ATP-binding protein [Syntrophothermus sp.]